MARPGQRKKFVRQGGATANQKAITVTESMGIKGINGMQATTRAIYDSLKLATTSGISVLQFFENVNTRKFPFTNISENKLQVGEILAMQRFSFLILEIEASTQKVISINPLAAIGQFKVMYRSDMSISIAQDQVIKKLPLQGLYSAFNKDAKFNGSQTFGTNPGNTTSFEVSHDVFHFDNPIIIPPQIEFTMQLQIPAITLPAAPDRDWHIMVTLEGLGSLFAPKTNY